MKPRISLVSVVCLAMLSAFVLVSCGSSDLEKAKEFVAAGMYPQAIELLNKSISEKPDDAEAHFQLGVCYINTGDHSMADKRFASAVRLKSDYGHQIGGEYKKAGTERLNDGRVREISALYHKAVEYDPSLKKGIAQEVFDRAKQGQGDVDGLFSLAVSLDESLKAEVGDHYYTLSQEAEGERSVVLLKQANTYSGKHGQELGEKLLAVAKEKPKKERKLYIDQAKKYLPQAEIDAAFPPPTWKTVFGPKEYVGQGMGAKEYVRTIQNGRDFVYGDRVTITGQPFKVFHDYEWKDSDNGQFTFVQKGSQKEKYIGVKAPKGQIFTVEVQRLETSY